VATGVGVEVAAGVGVVVAAYTTLPEIPNVTLLLLLSISILKNDITIHRTVIKETNFPNDFLIIFNLPFVFYYTCFFFWAL
jgi:hypothetical protein